jgi:hypothetical protein
MQEIVSWVMSHWTEIIEIYLAVVGLASVIVKMTPTLKDDNFLKGVIRFIGKFIALNRK